MKRFGVLLTWLGAGVGVVVGTAMFAHVGAPGATWLVNVALAKLGFIASGGLMAGGAVVQRFANRRKMELLTQPRRDGDDQLGE
jgi:hypothetical protein